MTLLRTLRRRLSLALVLSLLLAQWAMAGYVCPRAATSADGVATAAMPDCAGMSAVAMDPDQPQLCKAHCERGVQNVNATPQPEPATCFSVVAVLDWRDIAALPTQIRPMAREIEAPAPPPGAPPIYLVLRVLRD